MENTLSRWLCTFEINNNQNGYAQCLKQVLRLEDISKSKNYNDCVQDDFLEFYISRWKNNNINSEAFIVQHEEIIKNIDKHTIKKIESEKGLLEGLKIDNLNHMFYYYIRVNMDNIDSDITNLMYLVLSLQTLEKINDRIVVYFYTNQNKFSLYFKLTHFLRLIIEHYTFMYASIDNKSVKLLKNEHEYIQKTFFPILEVDENLYNIFNRAWNVNFDEPFDKFDNLYDKITIYQENKEIDDLTCLIFKTSFRMLFDNLDGRKYPQFNNKNKLLNSIHNLISSNQGVTPLEMLLFGSLIVNEDKKFDENNSEELLKNIKNLSTAIMQIIENIVNHSEHKTGVFTLRLHNKNNKEYLNNNYPGYPIESSATCIEVLIADSNTKDNIIEHFVQGDKSADIVKQHKKQIYLCDFFGDYYAQNDKIWGEARKKNPEMCNGLLMYAQTIKKLNGATFVRSSHKFNNADTKNIYYFCKNNGLDSKKYNKLSYIPGTQFSLVFNKNFLLNHIFKNDKKYNFNKMLYSTTYRQLAQTLLFDNGAYEININNINTNIESQTDKDNRVKEIQDIFNEVYNKVYDNASDSCEEVKYNVFICDLGEYSKKSLNNNTLNEILSKSILSSKLCMETKNYNCLLLKNTTEAIKEYLNDTLKIMEYKSNLKLEHTCIYIYPYSSREQIYDDSEDDLPYFATSIPDPLNNKKIFPEIFPYMLINMHNDEDNKKTQFEEMMSRQANISIYKNGKQGYKIANTHMRLGNKVHLDAFYEMALFFENPNYASYASYLLIKKLINNIDAEQKLIFYGYASYSRAMVWATIQIIKEYFELIKTKCPEMEFIIYQNDLKEETNVPQEQMYYSNKDWQKDHSKVWKDNNTKLIMIVPISSSLTTFDKMNAELLREINITDEDKYFHNVEYYTTFWVRNKHIDGKQEVEEPTDEEKEFWTRVNLNKRQIFRKNGDKIINYFVSEKCAWENPLKCKKCFPKNALNEKPLVETDPTSTVPTQQLYIEDIKNDNSDIKIDIDNELRIAALYNNILYKHISKGGNHFQFYIKTKEYFLQQCVDVKNG